MKDDVLEAIRFALKAAKHAYREALGDVRTNGTCCTDDLDIAVECLEQAEAWLKNK